MPPECFLVDFERKSRKATSSWSRFLGSAGSGIREMERSQNRVDFCAWEPGRYQTHWDCWEWRNWSQTVLAVPGLEIPGREAEWTNDSLRLRNPLSFRMTNEVPCMSRAPSINSRSTRLKPEFGPSLVVPGQEACSRGGMWSTLGLSVFCRLPGFLTCQ